jgi:hypothetical protein
VVGEIRDRRGRTYGNSRREKVLRADYPVGVGRTALVLIIRGSLDRTVRATSWSGTRALFVVVMTRGRAGVHYLPVYNN